MSLRQVIQQNSAITTAITVVVIVGALITIVMQFAMSRPPGAIATEEYFSTDDGATWFADDVEKTPPFVKSGKDAVLAHVFRCGSGKPFVAYLERYLPEGKKAIDDAYANAKANPTKVLPPNEQFLTTMRMRYGEIKKPGDSRWVNESRDVAAYTTIMRFTCPGGDLNDLGIVKP